MPKKFIFVLFFILLLNSVCSSPTEWQNVLNHSFVTGDESYWSSGLCSTTCDMTQDVFSVVPISAGKFWDGSYMGRMNTTASSTRGIIYNASLDDANLVRLYYDQNSGSYPYYLSVMCIDSLTSATASLDAGDNSVFPADNTHLRNVCW